MYLILTMVFKKNKIKGFTLIELLVVVAIISLLSSIVMASLNSARVKARNAARLSAVHELVNAFNLGLAESGSLPKSCSWACVSDDCSGFWDDYAINQEVDTFLALSLPQKLQDPTGGSRGSSGFSYKNSSLTEFFGISGAWLGYIMEPGGSCGPGTLFPPATD